MNADYYINKVLNPFLAKDSPRLFPDREGAMEFHQDSASGHTAMKTTDFLNKHKAYCTCIMDARVLMLPLWNMEGYKTANFTP